MTNKSLESDVGAIKYIQRKMYEEWKQEEDEWDEYMLRAEETRQAFHKRVQEREEMEAKLYRRRKAKTATGRRRTVTISKLSSRIEELARPKSAMPRDTSAADSLASRDFSGLLVMDASVRPFHPYKIKPKGGHSGGHSGSSVVNGGSGDTRPQTAAAIMMGARGGESPAGRRRPNTVSGNRVRTSTTTIQGALEDLDKFDAINRAPTPSRSEYADPPVRFQSKRAELKPLKVRSAHNYWRDCNISI